MVREERKESRAKECVAEFVPQSHMSIMIGMPETKEEKEVMPHAYQAGIGVQHAKKLPEYLHINMKQ